MLVLKMMSNEDKADGNASKCFTLICCDNVYFRRDDGVAIAVVNAGGDTMPYCLDGNAYVMQNGKTIASFAYSDIPD
jgi:hypothetical protein